jgi:hypothetical protein
MPKKDTPKTLSKLPKPSRFLLADENWEDYEYRQLELITRCDIDIDRQYRMISQHLNPLGEAESKGAEIVAEWHRQAIAMLFEMQDRRKRAAVPDAEIMGAGDG